MQSGLLTQQGNTNTHSSRYESPQLPSINNIAPRINNNLPVLIPHVNRLPVMEPTLNVNPNPPFMEPNVTDYPNNSQGNNSSTNNNQSNSNYSNNNNQGNDYTNSNNNT